MAMASPVKNTPNAVSMSASSGGLKSLRGLNKPKCIKCGNVARSRCPYQSCKNCCAKAQNPCHIHVLKGSSSLPDKAPSSSPALFDQQSTEPSHSGNSSRVRQLSNNFAQFNNLQALNRSRKPLTRKDAQVINEWRFLKLKEFKERNIGTETEAFDRYMQNVSLLEEVFSVNSDPEEQLQDETSSDAISSSAAENKDIVLQSLKLKLRSDPVRIDNFRKRIQFIVDQGLRKLGRSEQVDGAGELSDTEEMGRVAKKMKFGNSERTLALTDLCDKMEKARNAEDLKECREMTSQIFGSDTSMHQMEPGKTNPDIHVVSGSKSFYFPSKWVRTTTFDEEALSRLDKQFSSLEEIEDL